MAGVTPTTAVSSQMLLVIAIYSHNGYLPAQSSDYDSERAAQEMIQSLNSAG